MPLDFRVSEPLTFGVELEIMVLNTRDYDLARGAADLLERLKRADLPGEVKPEITESMIEINSAVNRSYDTLLTQLRAVRDGIVRAADRLNLAVAGGGAHPYHRWTERRIFPTERFLKVSNLYGYLAKQFTVFGQHIHVGVASPDDAVYLTHALAPYIPHFIALSASSPFAQGQETSFDTSRLHAVSAFPLAGQMPPVTTWEQFTRYFDEMQGYGIVGSMKDFYWDIRPKPEYGTIEIRICDTPLTIELAAQLAAYAQTLAAELLEHRRDDPVEPLYRVYGYNRFQACRFGFEAALVDPWQKRNVNLREDLLATLDRLLPRSVAMGNTMPLRALAELARARRNGANWLREEYAQTRSMPDVVRRQALLWREGEKPSPVSTAPSPDS